MINYDRLNHEDQTLLEEWVTSFELWKWCFDVWSKRHWITYLDITGVNSIMLSMILDRDVDEV